MKNTSISRKIFYRGLIASVLLFIVALFVMYNLVLYYFKPVIFDHAEINVKNKADEITTYLEGNKKFLQSVLVHYQHDSASVNNIPNWLIHNKIEDKYLRHLAYLNIDGNLILDNGKKIDFASQRNYLKNNNNYYEDLIKNNTKDYLVTDGVFLNLDGKKTPVFIQFLVIKDPNTHKATGAIGGIYDIGYLSEIIKNIRLSDYTLSLVNDANGLVIGHTNKNFVAKWNVSKENKGIKGLEKIVIDQVNNPHFEIYELYMDTTNIEGADNSDGITKAELRIVMAPIPNSDGWTLSVAAPYILILWPMLKTIMAIAISFLISLFIFMLVFFVSNKLLNKEVISVAEKLKDISVGDGDLTQRLKVLPGNDGLHMLTTNFNLFLDSISNLIKDVKISYETLDGYVENIFDSTFKMSDAIRDQEDKINEISVSMSQLVENVNDIAKLSQSASETAQIGSKDTQEGQEIVSNIISIIKQQTETINATNINIQALQKAGISIGEVMEVINGIAEQTNLLALNAAIEAARAGEAGRGFAVVADEVRSLAGRTHESTQEIQNTVQNLQASITNATDSMNASIRQSDITEMEAGEAGERLNKLTISIKSMESMNLQIASATEEQSATFDNLNSNLGMVVDLATATNNLSMDLTNKGAQLSDTAQNLKKLIERFKI